MSVRVSVAVLGGAPTARPGTHGTADVNARSRSSHARASLYIGIWAISDLTLGCAKGSAIGKGALLIADRSPLGRSLYQPPMARCRPFAPLRNVGVQTVM